MNNMMTLEERLDRFEQRQEAMIAAMGRMTDILIMMRDAQAELIAWLKQPPGTELSDLIRQLIFAVNAQTAETSRLGQGIAEIHTMLLHRL